MKNVPYLILAILFFSSCNNEQLAKENHRLNDKLEEKEMIILNQLKEIEEKKSEIRLLNQEIRALNDELSNTSTKKELTELYDDVKSAVYIIYTEEEEGVSQGSAFVISNNGLAISNYHVFKNASDAIAINGDGDMFLISDILEVNPEEDFIIFRLGPLNNPTPFVKVSAVTPKIGEEVFAVGNPKGLTQTLSTGIVSGYRNHLIQTTTEITHGSSGGPLFNEKGEVIGITSLGFGEANLNFAVNINILNLNQYLLSENSGPIRNTLSRQNLISILRSYYSAQVDEDFDFLLGIYTNKLSRYHSLYSVSKYVAMKDFKEEYISKYKITSVTIKPETVEIYKNNFGYNIQYQIDYNIIKRKNNKPLHFVLNTVCLITSDGKIKSIYDNILKRG